MKHIYILLAVVWMLSGCASLIPSPPPIPEPPPVNPQPEPPQPPPQPPTVESYRPRLGLSWFTYSLHDQLKSGAMRSHLAWLAAECDRLALPRNEIYFTVEVHSDAGFSSAGGNWKDHYAVRCSEAVEAHRMIASYGFGTAIVVWNSNTPGKGYKGMGWSPDKAFILSKAEALMRAVGHDRAMWLPCSESDASTPKDIQSGLRALPGKLGFPANRVMQDDHPAGFYRISTITGDNWPAIKDGYDGSGSEYCAPDVARHKRAIDKYAKGGRPFSFYTVCIHGDVVAGHEAAWRQILEHWRAKR